MAMYVNPISSEKPLEEARIAAQVQAERRRAARMKRKFITQATPWAPGVPSVPIEVIIEDLSEVGAGVIHDQPVNVGMPFLLNVPQGDQGRSIVKEFVVVRCDRRGVGKYSIGMQLRNATDPIKIEPKRVCSKRLKTLFLLFGIFGLIIASLAPF